MSAKAQEDLKQDINTLGVKYKIRYHQDMHVRDTIYEGGDWSESFDDGDNPVWRSILPQLPPWIRNPSGGGGVSEEGGTPLRLPALSRLTLSLVQSPLQKTFKANLKQGMRKETKYISPGEHLENVKIPSKTWDNVVSHTSTSRNESDPNSSDNHTTMFRQGE